MKLRLKERDDIKKMLYEESENCYDDRLSKLSKKLIRFLCFLAAISSAISWAFFFSKSRYFCVYFVTLGLSTGILLISFGISGNCNGGRKGINNPILFCHHTIFAHALSTSVIASICKILEIEEPQESEVK